MCVVKETLVQELKEVIATHNAEKLERRLPHTLGLPAQSAAPPQSVQRFQPPPKKKSTPAKRKGRNTNATTTTTTTTAVSVIQTGAPNESAVSPPAPEEQVQLQHMPSFGFNNVENYRTASLVTKANSTEHENQLIAINNPEEDDALLADSIDEMLRNEQPTQVEHTSNETPETRKVEMFR